MSICSLIMLLNQALRLVFLCHDVKQMLEFCKKILNCIFLTYLSSQQHNKKPFTLCCLWSVAQLCFVCESTWRLWRFLISDCFDDVISEQRIKQFKMNQIVGILKLLRWKTKVQTFRKELLFNIRKCILGKIKNNFFGIVVSLAFL